MVTGVANMSEKGVNIFTFLNQIFYKTAKHKYDKKVANAYILSLWLSHDPELLQIISEINPYIFSLNDEQIYNYFFHKIPKKKRYIKWIKKKEKKEDKSIKERLENLKLKHDISKIEAEKFRKLLGR